MSIDWYDRAQTAESELLLMRAEIEQLRAQVARLHAALKPFADAADTLASFPDATRLDLAPITLGDLREARRARDERIADSNETKEKTT